MGTTWEMGGGSWSAWRDGFWRYVALDMRDDPFNADLVLCDRLLRSDDDAVRPVGSSALCALQLDEAGFERNWKRVLVGQG